MEVVAQRRLLLILLDATQVVDAYQLSVTLGLELIQLLPQADSERCVLEHEVGFRQVHHHDDGCFHPLELASFRTDELHVVAYERDVAVANGGENALLLGAGPVGMVGLREVGPGIEVLLEEREGVGDDRHGVG